MSTGRPVRIPSRKAALQLVSRYLGGHLPASTTDEILGWDGAEDKLTRAEAGRLNWAVDEVARRLYAVGGRS
jgi:hypothetical protein